MNNRRSFFKSLIGLIVAPKVAEALPVTKPTVPARFMRVFPELLATELVGVQPMSGPTGMVFHMKYINDKTGS